MYVFGIDLPATLVFLILFITQIVIALQLRQLFHGNVAHHLRHHPAYHKPHKKHAHKAHHKKAHKEHHEEHHEPKHVKKHEEPAEISIDEPSIEYTYNEEEK